MARRIAVVVSMVGLLAAAGGAQDVTEVLSRNVAKDNFNDTLNPDTNWGTRDCYRVAKGKQETTWYGDWDSDDLADIWTAYTGAPTPGAERRVYFGINSNDYGSTDPNRTHSDPWIHVEAFESTTSNWGETTATNNNYDGASAWGVVGSGTGTFWQLSAAATNSLMMDWQASANPPPENTLQLDHALVDALCNRTGANADVAGLRLWGDGAWNDYGSARERWSSDPRIFVGEVTLATPGVNTFTYTADKDTCCIAGGQSSVNTGARTHIRAGKGTRSSGEQPLVGWTDQTKDTIVGTMSAQLAANRLTMAEAIACGALKVSYEMSGVHWNSDPQKTIHLETVWSLNDWAEGDGVDDNASFDWSAGTKAATWLYAQDAWTYSGTVKVRDTANAVVWDAPDQGWSGQEYKQLNGTAGPSFTGTLVGGPEASPQFNSVELPEAFWKDLLMDEQGGGATNYPCVGIRQYGDAWGDNDNWDMWTREAGSGTGPRLVIEMRPHIGDATINGEVDVLDLARLANNFGKTGAEWGDADFNGDGVVDVLDLAAIANNFGWQTAGGGAGGGAPVPEPASAALLALGACLPLLRRRR